MRSLAAAGLLGAMPVAPLAATALVVGNVTGLYPVEVARIAAPRSAAEVAALLKSWPGRVAVGGGRYSMGGQVAVRGGMHLDMRRMNRLVWLRPDERIARVQAGMRWRDLQDHLDPLGLAVRTMQSFSNFTVGGSVSVNAHGRYVGHGPVGHTVRALQLVLADGSVVEVDAASDPEVFRAAIGGYGAVGVITEVELDLAENMRIERVVDALPLERYIAHFKAKVLADPRAILHNADLLPPAFDAPVSVTWLRAPDDKALTETARLVARGRSYDLEQNVIWAATEMPGGQALRRKLVHPLLMGKPVVKWLNHEASLDVAELEPRTRAMSTYVLQEFFVPERHFLGFARAMAAILATHDVEALNVSIRHSPVDRVSLLPWAREDVFSFVLYYKQRTWASAREAVGRWTRELVDAVLRHEGRYYLPYQLHATQAQFEAAYPEVSALRRVKARVDPSGKFSNELWRSYL
ncbi:MAG TPA: FAD-binding oxidoreductase [Methylibium sp.]|nr:FAD-binding oxidoreductase [Methylibium sp.]